jgi:hypothetical protein
MTQELVDKFKAYAEERRKEREASTDRGACAETLAGNRLPGRKWGSQ